ncbi:MAG TPA: flagellar motor switch protein FliG [Candidatus Megaira endosymbiont of Hartmannula sinica]|nr:flagellar motor switch protein FliG [Candidatus Megaera endosymbiont of Hartmannula sinica]
MKNKNNIQQNNINGNKTNNIKNSLNKGNINYTDKIAIIMLSLPEKIVTQIFSLMTEEEMIEVSYAMSRLSNISKEEVSSTLIEMKNDINNSRSVVGNISSTIKILEQVVDKEKVDEILEYINGPQGKNTWEKLSNVNEDLLVVYLQNEHPQTAALILSKITPDHAAKILDKMPDEFAFNTISRILNLNKIQKNTLERIEKHLRVQFINNITKMQKYDTVKMLAEIFNNLGKPHEQKLMSMLESKTPEAASAIKNMMFTFDDLIKLDTQSKQKLIKNIEFNDLVIAMKGSSEEIKNSITESMSKRAASNVFDEINSLGRIKIKEIEKSRNKIITVAKTMIDKGEIEISLGNNDEYVY